MSERAAVGSQPSVGSPVVDEAPRPYAPSWLHSVVTFIEQLPGPGWIPYAAAFVVATLFWHLQAWSGGQVPAGKLDPVSTFWGFLAPALLWCATFMERVAASAFEAFRRSLTMSPDDSARLRYALVVVPARPAWIITLLAAAMTAADIALSGNPTYAGQALPMLVMALLVQTFYVSVMFQLLYRMVRQMGLVRRTLATSVVIDIFRPGPLNAFATLTSRPGAALTLLVASSIFVVPLPSDLGAYIVGWAPYVAVPPIIAAIAFVVPLTGVHAALVEQKERLQDAAQARLQGALADMAREVDAGDLSRADAWSKTLANLQVEGAILAKLPTWPWSMSTLRSFVSAILLPMALFLAQQALSRLLQAEG